MSSRHVRLSIIGAALTVVAILAVPLALRARATGNTDMVFGTRPAEIIESKPGGALGEGDAVTFLPNIAPLKPGNRTHNVRFDIVAQEIEITPGVRYQAWTFDGSVPGPVIHVREGDRINFVMRNRTHEKVATSAPDSGGSPFVEQLAAASLQKAVPALAPMHHSIDFHAATVAADDKWRMVLPGRSINFEWVANVGPNDQSSTHVIGAIFDRVWYEGNPKNAMRGMQTVLIGSSNGAVLEFIVPEEGRYVLVDHEFADASKGAIGQIIGLSRDGRTTSLMPPVQH